MIALACTGATLGCGTDGPTTPSVAADASRIGFIEYRTSETGTVTGAVLSVVDADGTGYRTVTPVGHFVRAWDWHPATNRVAYVAHQEPGIQIVDVETGSVTRVAAGVGDGLATPRWSPDGARIAFLNDQGALSPEYGVHVVRADGTGLRDLTTSLDSEGPPSWSPDGTRIVFSSGAGLIWTVRPDGTCLISSAPLPTTATLPRWSPNGRQLVYTGGGSIWTIGADLRTPRRVTPECVPDCPGYSGVDWAPAGDRLVAFAERDQAVVAIALNGATTATLTGALDVGDWSADGTRLAFSRRRFPGTLGVITTAADGSDETVAWSPEVSSGGPGTPSRTLGFAIAVRWIP